MQIYKIIFPITLLILEIVFTRAAPAFDNLFMVTLACVIWCSRPPNSERDIADTQSRYANRKVVHNSELPPRLSNLTHNRHRQERKLYKCRNNSITSIAIFHASSVGLQRHFLLFQQIFLILVRIHEGNPRVPPRVLASGPKPCGHRSHRKGSQTERDQCHYNIW